MIEDLSRSRRKELLSAATTLLKSGAEPSGEAPEHYTRAQVRQAQRAVGNRGAKARRANPEKHMKRTIEGARRVARVVMTDELLDVAKDRVEHPIRSRLRRS
jgi:hypothetical protein